MEHNAISMLRRSPTFSLSKKGGKSGRILRTHTMMVVYGIKRTTLDDAAWRRSEKHLTLKLALVKK